VRILQIAPPWFPVPPTGYGGTEQVVALLADGLVERGHEVTLVAAGGSTSRARLRTTFSTPPTAKLGDATIALTHGVAAYQGAHGFDVIHDHTAAGAALGAFAGNAPVVHTVHGPWTSDASGLYELIHDRVHLVAISHDHARRAPSGIRLAGVVPNGIDVAAHPFVAEPSGDLAFVGRANPEKGPLLAIEVARRLGRHLRMAIKVNEPEEHEYFETQIAPALEHADAEVVPITSHADKCRLLGEAAVVLFPITWPEPFGLVPVEANACGTPVVAFAEGAVPEIVEHGRTGVLVASGDLDGFAAAIERAERLERATCRAVVTERFDAAQMVARYERLYRRVSGSRTRVIHLPNAPSRAEGVPPV
jgi:glycosyltransferase involved in cell wall biosynthesis